MTVLKFVISCNLFSFKYTLLRETNVITNKTIFCSDWRIFHSSKKLFIGGGRTCGYLKCTAYFGSKFGSTLGSLYLFQNEIDFIEIWLNLFDLYGGFTFEMKFRLFLSHVRECAKREHSRIAGSVYASNYFRTVSSMLFICIYSFNRSNVLFWKYSSIPGLFLMLRMSFLSFFLFLLVSTEEWSVENIDWMNCSIKVTWTKNFTSRNNYSMQDEWINYAPGMNSVLTYSGATNLSVR